MARPQSVSDETILQAARKVVARRGYDAFTLSEVAEEVGLSRAAIILRFKSTEALKLKLASDLSGGFSERLAALPVARSGDRLLELADLIGQMIANHEAFATFIGAYHANMRDPKLAAVELERADHLRAAIAARMPKTVLKRESAVTAYLANLAGSIMQWEAMPGVRPSDYLLARTREWLTLAQISFTPAAIHKASARVKTTRKA